MARDLANVLEALLAGVVVLDAEGRVEVVNGAACRFLELSADALRGREVEHVLGAEHAAARLARRALATGLSASEGDQRLTRRGAPPLPVDVAASPLQDEAGGVDGVVLVLRDRSAQHRLEQVDAERERLASFGRIAAGLAHEVKNPLGGIRGAAELLAARARDDKSRETAELVLRESRRITGLVDELMVFASAERLALAPVNLHRVLDDVARLLALDPEAGAVAIERSYDPSIPELLADADRLEQVFLNLGRNALQALAGAPEGHLRLESRTALEHRVSTPDGRLVPSVEVTVRDDGSGMEADALRQATTPFFTTRSRGTGLGLAVAEYWVAQHGGSLRLESAPGEGTAAHVTLPLRREP